MLTIVIAKPMQLMIVNELPLDSTGAFWATSVENSGESAITAILHTNRKTMKVTVEPANRNNGDRMQQAQDSISAAVAVRLTPMLCDTSPPSTQDMLPEAIIQKDNKGTLRCLAG